jgi:hypothetical protein
MKTYDIREALDRLHATGQRVTGPLRWLPHPTKPGRMIVAVPVGPVEPEPAFRSKTERAWARLFDRLGIEWRYECLEERIARALRYRPDFWLPEVGVFVEVKGQPPTPGEIRVARELRQATGARVYILAGWPAWGRFGVWVFDAAGDVTTTRPDWTGLVLCQWADCGFSEVKGAMKNGR